MTLPCLLADGIVTITPAEPTALQLMVIGATTLAALTAAGAFRRKRSPLQIFHTKSQPVTKPQHHSHRRHRAA
jgi:hypothetical protein